MKTSSVLPVVAVATLLHGPAASAQTADPRPRGDVWGSVAWQRAEGRAPGVYVGSDWSGSLFGGGAVGWYWTEHLKTELDFGASTSADSYRTDSAFIDGRWVFRSSRLTFSRRTLAVAQQYQFYENAWFHPHVAAGAQVTWERRIEEFFPDTVISGPGDRGDIRNRADIVGPSIETTVRPFVAGGFKAYLTPRTFLRVDTRVAFRARLEESLFRIGFGVDF